MGIERCVSWICGLEHVLVTIPYPRMLYRIYPEQTEEQEKEIRCQRGNSLSPVRLSPVLLLHWVDPMKIGFVSLGCPKNLVDSEVMLGMAEKDGHESTADASQADVLVVNTCAFIDRAKQESIDTILERAPSKSQATGRRPLDTARLAEGYHEEVKEEKTEHDVVLGTGEVAYFPAALSGTADREPGAAMPMTFYGRDSQPASGSRLEAPVFGIDLPTYLYDASTPRKRVTPSHY